MIQEELLEIVTGFLRGQVKEIEVDELSGLVENFEFDAAIEKLKELATKTGVNIE